MATIQQPRLPMGYKTQFSPEIVLYLSLLQEYIASLEARIKALEP